MMSKRKANYIHVKRRILERYGLDIDKQMYMQMMQQIRNGSSLPFGKQSNNRSVHAVRMCGQRIIVVYEKQSGSIVTALLPCRSYHFC